VEIYKMRILSLAFLATVLLTGCDQSRPAPVQPVTPPSQPLPPAQVDVGGPQGGVHVNDPAGGTKVDVDGSGVHVKTPETKVDVP
jgi:hypothetical protein